MSIERLLAIALFVASVAVLIRSTPAAITIWRVYSGTGQRRQQDATDRAPAPNVDVGTRIGRLSELGYDSIGTTSLAMPDGETFQWILVAADRESYAILIESPTDDVGLTGLYAAWPDGTWLGTIQPRGEAHLEAGLQVQIVTSTLADAVATHQNRLQVLRGAHGRPRRVERMADMLALDAEYRMRFGARELRPMVARALFPVGLTALCAVVAFILAATLPA